MILELIFVRHGESCGNALLKASAFGILSHKLYKDPELTTKGRILSEAKANHLAATLEGSPEFASRHFYVGSSPLLRAQETAYWMAAKPNGKAVNVMPYLGETGAPGLDNRYNNAKLQNETLKVRFGLEDFRRGKDERTNPDFDKFWKWAIAHKDWFFRGEDNVYRAILFTHSNTLKEEFPLKNCVNPPSKHLEGNKLANNDYLVTIYNTGPESDLKGKKFLDEKAVYPKWRYYDTRDVESVEAVCGIDKRCIKQKNVPVTSPCKEIKGGKTRRLRRSRSRRRFEK